MKESEAVLTLEQEVGRRRSFAIISHPDAGKTTITEMILWNAEVIREAGQVKGKKGSKAATSDWMALEKERGVSITSSVMQFDYGSLMVNLLDTPGHKDFSEDTYRTLLAADSAAMLIDAAKGVEEQTRKLFEVCRLRKLPIFTFANKMDREGKEALALIDDVESTLGIRCYPMTWPLGMGDRFAGLYHRGEECVYLYQKGVEEPVCHSVNGWRDPRIQEWVDPYCYQVFLDEMELLDGALGPLNHEEFLRGEVSPMTFGSAKNNWGVDLFLKLFADLAPPPIARKAEQGLIEPSSPHFSGFVFKIQANMDRKHRDRVAFLRVCSGKFYRGMKVKHMRLDRELRLSYANQFMAQSRDTVEEAYAGDVVGLVDTGHFQVGDSISDGPRIRYADVPRFSPERFAKVNIKDPLKRKQLQKAIGQLAEEGMIQLFFDPHFGRQDPVIGVVGELQFDVLMYRLNDEYGLEAKLERLPLGVARWPVDTEGRPVGSALNGGEKLFEDGQGLPVVLLEKEWDLNWLERENPGVEFRISGSAGDWS